MQGDGQRIGGERPHRRTRPIVVVFAAVAFLATAVAGCGDDDGDGSVEGIQFLTADVERAAPSADAASEAGEATTAFGIDLYAELGEDGNLVFSPYSVAVALAMTRAGAIGATADEMDVVLHTDALADVHAAFGSLDAELSERPGTYSIPGAEPVELELSFGNALWPQRDFPFEEAFLELLAGHYGAGVQAVDYGADPDGARDAINGWVADETRDRIPELIPPGVLSALTRLVLTNAVYLNAPWRSPFDEGGTSDEPFELLDGSTVTAPLMHLRDTLDHAAGDDWQAVRLPYAGGDLAMVVLVPDRGSFRDVEARIEGAFISAVDAELRDRPVDLRFPRFEFRSQIGLDDPLRTLGMPTAFTEAADFSAMSPEALMITNVLHEAFISVDEEGTEAAAATAVVIGETAAPVDPVELAVDRPYLFWIVDEPTGAVLFLGRVLDPTAD